MPDGAKVAGWLTVRRAALRLGVPKKRLETLVSSGVLHPETDFYGRRRFDPTELDKIRDQGSRPGLVPARARGAISGPAAARVFRMFGEGAELRAIVLEVEITPEQVFDLRRQYAAMGRDLLVPPPELEQLRELLDWNGDNAAGLVRRVNERLREQFRRGQLAGIKNPPGNHNEREVSSG